MATITPLSSPQGFPFGCLHLCCPRLFKHSLQARKFTHIQGYEFEAEFLRTNGEFVELQDPQGRKKWFPISNFIQDDKDFIKEQAGNLSSLNAMNLRDVVFRANNIDRFIQTEFRTHNIKQNPPSTDEQFIRRAYLDIIGRIPSYDEVTSFLDSEDTSKRRKIIDELLAHMGISATTTTTGPISSASARMSARVMVVPTSSGLSRPFGKTDPTTFLSSNSSPLVVTLGIILPSVTTSAIRVRRWTTCPTQYKYSSEHVSSALNATITRLRTGHRWSTTRWLPTPMVLRPASVLKTLKVPASSSAKLLAATANVSVHGKSDPRSFEPITFGAMETKRPLRLPATYQYDDAKPRATIAPGPVFRQEVSFGKDETPREAYVRWMTSPENDLFVKVIANRIWKKVMGHGLFEPVDDLKKDTQESHPKLMGYLMELMREVNFDLKQYERILYNTPTYHRQVSTSDHVKGEPYYFSGPLLRRMTAEQLWDSLLSMTIQDSDERILRDREEIRVDQRKQQADYMLALTPEQIIDLASQIADIETKYADQRNELRRQMAAASAAGDNKRIDQLENQRRILERNARNEARSAQRQIQKGLSEDAMMAMDMEGEQTANAKTEVEMDPRWKGFPKSLVRAAELPSPAPNGHFLRMFGQSDRDTIENASVQPTVPPSSVSSKRSYVQGAHEVQLCANEASRNER